jgi:RND family efflux transporter MFP subunit
MVRPGDRVRKGQALVKLDNDEPRADVRAKQASLESARVALTENRRYLAAAEKAYSSGAMSEASYFAARATALRAEQDEWAARAAVDSAAAELEHYNVTAPIDDVVARLDVHPGMVSRPGTTVWGEILDLREIDVRCELTADQADSVTPGQAAEVRCGAARGVCGAGRVVFVAISADAGSGLVPVLVRLSNGTGRLRAGVPVRVQFDVRSPNAGVK